MPKAVPPKAGKNMKPQEQSAPNITNGQTSTREVISGAHPINCVKRISTWVCRNLACKAVMQPEDSFCKRCSCFICHRFDDNKDPSLWLVCASENDGKNCCGSSYHIECVLQHKRVGCFDIEKIIHLDGSFSCAACGKISGILGYLKRQLVIGKDARRLDVLCHRMYLTYRLLEGTSRFKELHEIIEDAKEKLESEVGPLDEVSANMAHGLVRRSSAGISVQKLCSKAIEKADEWLSSPNLHLQGSLPAACGFRFADVTSCSLVVTLKETSSCDTVKGYKLWYWKSKEQPSMEKPVIVPKDQRRMLVYKLSPCTEYSFRVISFSDDGILGHSESRCYTGSTEIFFKPATQNTAGGGSQMQQSSQMQQRDRNVSSESKGFKIRNIWKTSQERWAKEGRFEGFCENMHECSCSRSATEAEQQGNSEQELLPDACRKFSLNPSSAPDLNAEAHMAMDDATEKQHCHSKKRLARSNDSGNSETCAVGQNGCEQDDASAVCLDNHISGTRQWNEDYGHCIKVVRQLECDEHITSDFRMKFLTWYTLRSRQQDRRAVTRFIQTLGEKPSSLADELVRSFGEIINCKKPRAGF